MCIGTVYSVHGIKPANYIYYLCALVQCTVLSPSLDQRNLWISGRFQLPPLKKKLSPPGKIPDYDPDLYKYNINNLFNEVFVLSF